MTSAADRELLEASERLVQLLSSAAGELGAFVQQLRAATREVQSEREGERRE